MSTEPSLSKRFLDIPILDEHIAALSSENSISESSGRLILQDKKSDQVVAFTRTDLLRLDKGNGVTERVVKYYDGFGIYSDDFVEVFVEIQHPHYPNLSTWSDRKELNQNPIKFKIEDSLINLGKPSALFVFLMEPVYENSLYFREGFGNLHSLRISPIHGGASAIVQKALFYINSHYLAPSNLYASPSSVKAEHLDPLNFGVEEDPYNKRVLTASRTRVRSRKNVKDLPPVQLYNAGCSTVNIESFLYFFRILEFYSDRLSEQFINLKRNDPAVSGVGLLKAVKFELSEEKALKRLFKELFSGSSGRFILGYANRVLQQSFKDTDILTKELYQFRNSNVHAKEGQIISTYIPDPLTPTPLLNSWIQVTRVVAQLCIEKMSM